MKNYVVFPLSLIEETIRILQDNGAVFQRSADLWPAAAGLRSRWDYLREYAEWQSGGHRLGPVSFGAWCARRFARRRLRRLLGLNPASATPAGRPVVFLQHDADRNPVNTVRVMELEQRLGATSSNYFFRRRAPRYAGDDEPYEPDIKALQALEKAGLEIGYHLNALELAGYDLEAGWRIIAEDVEYFRQHFTLRSFVPHGGEPGPEGENNHWVEHRDCLADLVWAYGGRGIGSDIVWSDGSLECAGSIQLEDPREVARRVRGRMRVRFLFHPQYYGDVLRNELGNCGVTRTDWWRGLWPGHKPA
jgi:hypothetical protein